MDYNSPGSSVHGIFLARILEWVAFPFSRGSSWPRDQTHISCIAGRFFITESIFSKIYINCIIVFCSLNYLSHSVSVLSGCLDIVLNAAGFPNMLSGPWLFVHTYYQRPEHLFWISYTVGCVSLFTAESLPSGEILTRICVLGETWLINFTLRWTSVAFSVRLHLCVCIWEIVCVCVCERERESMYACASWAEVDIWHS